MDKNMEWRMAKIESLRKEIEQLWDKSEHFNDYYEKYNVKGSLSIHHVSYLCAMGLDKTEIHDTLKYKVQQKYLLESGFLQSEKEFEQYLEEKFDR